MVSTRNGTTNGPSNGATSARHLYNQEIHHIDSSEYAKESKAVPSELMAEAITYLHQDGIIVLDNAIDTAHLAALESILGPEAEVVARDPDHHFNFGYETRNMDQAPPLAAELMFDDVWANPIAMAILRNVLGPDLVCHYANGNTALQATGRQPVHADIDKPHPMYPFAYVLNIALCDVTAENGATEIWVGSHRESNIDQHTSADGEQGLTIKPEILKERRYHSPPIQPSTEKGSLMIRDVRLWHAGMPNGSDQPRIMLAFVVQPKWFQAPSKVLLPLKAKSLVERWYAETGLEYNAEWVDGDVDHRKVTSDEVDFSTRNEKLLELEALMHWPVHR